MLAFEARSPHCLFMNFCTYMSHTFCLCVSFTPPPVCAFFNPLCLCISFAFVRPPLGHWDNGSAGQKDTRTGRRQDT